MSAAHTSTPAPVPVHEALAAVQREIKAIGKDQNNKFQGFNFRGIDDVLNTIGPVFSRHGVTLTSRIDRYDREQVKTARSTATAATAWVTFVFHGPAGDTLETQVAAESWDTSDKATSKLMSVALRTALLQTFTVPTCEPDPDSYSYELAAGEDPVRQQPAWMATVTAKVNTLRARGCSQATFAVAAKFATRNRTGDPLEIANEQEANKLMQMLNRWTPATEEKFRKGAA